MKTHDAFFQYVAQLEPFASSTVRVAKTPLIQLKDAEKIKRYQGEISGHNGRLKESNKGAEVSLEKEEDKETETEIT